MLLLGPLLSIASAAVVTEIPPFLRGDIVIGYSYDLLSGSLVEREGVTETEVAQRALGEHALNYSLVFGAAPGVAVFIELPHPVSSRVSYDSLSYMVYDPSTGSGTYLGTNADEPGAYVDGGGLGGVWFGVRGTPFSEAFPKRNSRTTWLLEGAIRTADETNIWTVDAEGKRGAGPAGTAARVHTAFSTTFGTSSPYVSGTYVGEGVQAVTVTLPDGTTGSQVEVDPAEHGDLRIGVEVLAGQNEAAGSQLVFDLHLGVAYDSYGQLPSGFYLPNVLEASEGGLIVQSEAMEFGGGLAMHWRAFKNFELGVFADANYRLPQRIENPYPVYTGSDTVHVNAGTTLGVRFR